MSKSKASIIARCIHRGSKSITDVDPEYRSIVEEQYELWYGKALAD